MRHWDLTRPDSLAAVHRERKPDPACKRGAAIGLEAAFFTPSITLTPLLLEIGVAGNTLLSLSKSRHTLCAKRVGAFDLDCARSRSGDIALRNPGFVVRCPLPMARHAQFRAPRSGADACSHIQSAGANRVRTAATTLTV